MQKVETIPHQDFKAGFTVGYEAIAGRNWLKPLMPIQPLTLAGGTPFLMDVRCGVEAALGGRPRRDRKIREASA